MEVFFGVCKGGSPTLKFWVRGPKCCLIDSLNRLVRRFLPLHAGVFTLTGWCVICTHTDEPQRPKNAKSNEFRKKKHHLESARHSTGPAAVVANSGTPTSTFRNPKFAAACSTWCALVAAWCTHGLAKTALLTGGDDHPLVEKVY